MLAKIVTYNIHRCIGTDGRYDAPRVADVLHGLGPDIVALQEVENRGDATHDSLQLDYLAARLDMTAVPGLRIVRHWKEYGNALLTRFPVLATELHNVSRRWREPRGVIDATLGLPTGPLRVLATHLGLGRLERRFQTLQIARLIDAGDPLVPCVVLGDMNEWFGYSRHLAWLNRRLGVGAAVASFPSRWPFFKLDRIWLRPAVALEDVRVCATPLSRVASDHLPLCATINLAKLGAETVGESICADAEVPLESRPSPGG
ncbi:MAG: endonuclease/exonuclease/phosphatase family protein [Steroidobacteraceae bacterium]